MSKHIWVVESSGGRKWRPAGGLFVGALFNKKVAKTHLNTLANRSPGLKWRVAKYARIGVKQ
jgi:hypothetical protein